MINLPVKLDDSKTSDANWFEALEVDHVDELKLDVAVRVSRLMAAQGVTKTELAGRLGTSKPWVTKVLRGDGNPTLTTMQRIADALNCNAHVHFAPKGAVCVWTEVFPREAVQLSEPVLIPASEKLYFHPVDIHSNPRISSTFGVLTPMNFTSNSIGGLQNG